jgi:hypothetical protein
LIIEQNPQHPPDSPRVLDDRATEVIMEARKMPLGERRCAALREAGRLRIAAEINRWLSTKSARVGQAAIFGLATSLTIQRNGLLDLTSMTEWTNAVTGDPSTVKVVF